jgi:hypothetical protein
MVRVTLSVRKTVEENAAGYFEAAKKAKRKLEGAGTALQRFERELPALTKATETQAARKRDWYEQYRWTFSTDGTLIIAGRDATSNESIIKKHAEPTDTVLHTESPGSPFTIIKGAASDETKVEAAQFCAAYSSAWKNGLATLDVFWVNPDQISKTANTGEFIGKGSFMVRGEKHFLRPTITLALGVIDGRATAGVPALFPLRNANHVLLGPGKDKASDVAKRIATKLGLTVDAWVPLIPAGGSTILGWKKATTNKNQEPKETIE